MKNVKKLSVYFFIVHKSNTYIAKLCVEQQPPSDKISFGGIRKLSSKISRYCTSSADTE